MIEIVAERFGGPDVLQLNEVPDPEPGPGQVRIRITSIGMNHAELMARCGEYKIASGEPPFVPGLEAGGVIDALGPGVSDRQTGQRVILDVDAPRAPGGFGGTYRSHYIADATQTVPAPSEIPDEQLGAIWLPYLTAWGCLIWRQALQPGQFVAIPAASSSVGLAAAQIVRNAGATAIGLTTSAHKSDALKNLPESDFYEIVVTHEGRRMLDWRRDLRKITDGRGVDVFFDPVAAGAYLETEIRSLAQHGTIWVYGLLGEPGKVDVTPLIRKDGSIRGWLLNEVAAAGPDVLERGYREVLDGFAAGKYRQKIDGTYALMDARAAHEEMERGKHIGKMILVP